MNPRLDILPAAQRTLWPELSEIPPDFVLYGGTALASLPNSVQSRLMDAVRKVDLDQIPAIQPYPGGIVP